MHELQFIHGKSLIERVRGGVMQQTCMSRRDDFWTQLRFHCSYGGVGITRTSKNNFSQLKPFFTLFHPFSAIEPKCVLLNIIRCENVLLSSILFRMLSW